MRSVMGLVLVLVCANTVFAQMGGVNPQQAVVVNQNSVGQQNANEGWQGLVPVTPPPMMPPPVAQPGFPGYPPAAIPPEWLRNGYREEFQTINRHDVRPLRDWEHPMPYQNGVYPQGYNGYPTYQQSYPQYQYTLPQQPVTYYPPQPVTYCPPQCRPTYQPVCQPQYYQPQRQNCPGW